MKIYTKTGDMGQTSLATGERVNKADMRLETYGTADELNAWVGMLRATLGETDSSLDEQLLWVQNKLFNLGALLSMAPGEWLTMSDSRQIEDWIDGIQAQLTPLRAFVLPAGNETVARCHVCRTVTRRLERRMEEAGCSDKAARCFVNRLSDYFFVLSRRLGEQSHAAVTVWEK